MKCGNELPDCVTATTCEIFRKKLIFSNFVGYIKPIGETLFLMCWYTCIKFCLKNGMKYNDNNFERCFVESAMSKTLLSILAGRPSERFQMMLADQLCQAMQIV